MNATTHSDSRTPRDTPPEAPRDSAAKPAEVIEEGGTGSGARPSFTITEAASACAVSRKTITRKLAELGEAGAAKDADGIWRIPVEALLSVGLHPGRSLNPGTARREPVVDLRSARQTPAEHPQAPETITVPRDRWDDLRIRLARAEAESTERGRALEDARLALRALTAGPAAVSSPTTDSSSVVAPGSWEPATSTASRSEASMSARGAGASGVQEVPGTVPGPVPGLPPTPVPRSLAADSAVWDTLLPRAGAPTPGLTGTPGATPGSGVADPLPLDHFGSGVQGGQAPVPGSMGPYTDGPETVPALTTAQAPPLGQVVVTPRRRWWGGKR